MSSEQPILVLAEDSEVRERIAERTRRLGHRVIRAATPARALALACERQLHFDVGLLAAEPSILDQSGELEALRARSLSGALALIAAGPRPDTDAQQALRGAGVAIALWDPVGDHALRFFLNRVTSISDGTFPRGEPRSPTEWRASVFSSGREKQASVYCLSSGGAFLETPSPWLSGAEVAIELPLPSGPLTVVGRVVYTNVPGNLQRPGLPTGMAVRFTDTPEAERRALCRTVEDSVARYAL